MNSRRASTTSATPRSPADPREAVNYHAALQRRGAVRGVLLQLPDSSEKWPPTTSAIYLKDSWTVGRRLTLNLGLRYAHDNGFVPDQCREAAAPPSDVVFPAECFDKVQLPIWNTVAPRVHAAYDLVGRWQDRVKGGWGRYDQMRQLIVDVNRVSKGGIAYGVYRWRDLNGNNDFDLDETQPRSERTRFRRNRGRGLRRPGHPTGVVNPNERQPKQDEFSVSLERELVANMAMRVTGVYSRAMNTYRIQNNFRPYETYNIPITNRDPGADGEVGTADDGGLVTYYEFAADVAGRAIRGVHAHQRPRGRCELQERGSWRPSSGSRIAGSSWPPTRPRRKTDPSSTRWRSAASAKLERISSVTAGDLNPNDEINRADRTWDWDAKFSGSYTFPIDVLVSANFHHFSGDPFARRWNSRGA